MIEASAVKATGTASGVGDEWVVVKVAGSKVRISIGGDIDSTRRAFVTPEEALRISALLRRATDQINRNQKETTNA